MKRIIFLALLAVSLAGCQFANPFLFPFWGVADVVPEPSVPTHQIFITPNFHGTRPSRVVLLASNQNAGSYDENQRLINELAVRFRAEGLFEVVTPKMRLPSHMDNIQQGKFGERDVARISREFNADSICLVRVNELRSFPPIRTSITLAFVDSNESVVACGVDGVWDLAEVSTRRDFKSFLMQDGTDCSNQLYLQSPNALFKFVASQISQSIRNSGY